jgi:hypothetical protein
MAIVKALKMAKMTAISTAAKILSGRYLIPPTTTRATSKVSY